MKDERKTKKQLIEELEVSRQDCAELRRQLGEGGPPDVRRKLAAERVRAEAMAMRSSEDMGRVVGVLFAEMAECGIGVDQGGCNILLIDESTQQVTNCIAGPNWRKFGVSWTDSALLEFSEEILVEVMTGPLKEDDTMVAQWRAGTASSAVGWVVSEAWFTEWVESRGGLVTPSLLGACTGEFCICNVPFEHGTIGLSVREDAEQHIGTVQDLAEGLSLGYTRYLDFQRLEERERQLVVEKCSERIRGEVMAMRSSRDLLRVVGVMHRQLLDLALPVITSWVDFRDPDSGKSIAYQAFPNPRREGVEWSSPELCEVDDDTVVTAIELQDDMIEEYRTTVPHGQSWGAFHVSSDRLSNWFGRLSMKFGLLRPWSVPSVDAKGIFVPTESGMIGAIVSDFNEGHTAVIEDFTEAISLGFLRFQDFEEAERSRQRLVDDLEEELQVARDMQMGLMPTAPPETAGLSAAGRCVTVNHVGGDFFQYFEQDGGLTISLADVTGHAMEAAIPAVMFSGVLDKQMEIPTTLEGRFSGLNRSMCRSLGEHTYVCLSMLGLDPSGRSMRVANCGCPYPLHYHADTGQIEEIQIEAYPLGIRADTEYTAKEVALSPGDYVVLHSDGFSEAANAEEQLFGFDRTMEVIRQGCAEGLSPEELIDRLTAEVKTFTGDEPQADDMTCVVMKVEI